MKYNCIIIYLLLFLISISAISCEKETVITISNESFEEYFPYHENGKSYNEPFRLERNREIIPATSYRNTAHPIFVPTYCFSRIGSYPTMTSPLHRPLV